MPLLTNVERLLQSVVFRHFRDVIRSCRGGTSVFVRARKAFSSPSCEEGQRKNMQISRRSFTKKSASLIGAALVPRSNLKIPSALARLAGDPAWARRKDRHCRSSSALTSRTGSIPLTCPAAWLVFALAQTLSTELLPWLAALCLNTFPRAWKPLASSRPARDGHSPWRDEPPEHPELLKVKRQELDLATGELLTEMVFHRERRDAADRGAAIHITSIPSLLCQEIRIVPSEAVQIEVVASISGAGIPGKSFRNRLPSVRKPRHALREPRWTQPPGSGDFCVCS
jgi:hypothetical protein